MTSQTQKVRDAGTGRLRKATDLDRDRIRFNWGYHDGAWEWNNYQGPAPIREANGGPNWKRNHRDPVYMVGYEAGQEDAQRGFYKGDSTLAWERARRLAQVQAPDHCSDYRVQARRAA